MTGEGRTGWRPGAGADAALSAASDPDAPAGVRVVIDLRPIQDPERAPVTAVYLEQLLSALDADPVEGESFSFLLAADQDDPTERWPNLEVVGRRLLPPTRLLRSGALTVDPILLRGASLGAGWRAERDGAAGTVYHAAAGALPIASGIPIVAAVLDLAPWAMPEAYQRGVAARFGQRIRARLLKDAAAVLVPGRATAIEARRLLHVKQARLRVVPLAARDAFREAVSSAGVQEAVRLGLGPRYAVYAGRYDARQDLPTLLDALAILSREAAPAGLPTTRGGRGIDAAPAWPPRICLVGATPDDRAALSRAASRAGVADAMAYAPLLPPDRLAALVAGARFLVQPVRLGDERARGPRGARGRGACRGERGRRPARGRRGGGDPRRARRRRPPRDRAPCGLVGRRPPRTARRGGCRAARQRPDVGGRRARDAGRVGGRRPPGAAALGGRPGRLLHQGAGGSLRARGGRRRRGRRHLAVLDRGTEPLGDHLDERLADRHRDRLAVLARRTASAPSATSCARCP